MSYNQTQEQITNDLAGFTEALHVVKNGLSHGDFVAVMYSAILVAQSHPNYTPKECFRLALAAYAENCQNVMEIGIVANALDLISKLS